MPKNVLIVEDERLIADDLINTITEFNYNVTGLATSGKDAVNMAIEMKPDLILMDITLEDNLTGIEAAKLIYKKQQTPIIFVTSYADEETLEGAVECRPYAYIVKPFIKRDLKIALKIAFALISKQK